MAYMNQAKKKEISALLKFAMKDSGLKYSLSVRNHSTICMTVKSATLDFLANHKEVYPDTFVKTDMRVNEFCAKNQFSGKCLEIVEKALEILNKDNYDNSDSMTDYFDVGHYVELSFGSWDKPFVVSK